MATNKLAVYSLDADKDNSIETVIFKDVKNNYQENMLDSVDHAFVVSIGEGLNLSHIMVAE